MAIVSVGLDVPVPRLFDYLAPGAGELDVGQRVVVPFGKRTAVGVVLDVSEHSDLPRDKLKTVTRFLRNAPALSADDLRLLRFASEYYHYPLGQVVMNALPSRLRRPEPIADAGEAEYALTDSGRAQRVEDVPARSRVKRKLLEALASGGALSLAQAKALAATAPATLREFEAAGWVVRRRPGTAAAEAAEAAQAVDTSEDLA